MARKYYYNPETTKPSHERKLDWDVSNYRDYVDSHPYMRKMLRKCAKEGGVRVPSLKATLFAAGACSHDFCTTAGQKTMAKKAEVCVRTLQKCIYIMRKNKVLSTKHRYTKGPNKRRTTSKTVINAYVKFVDYLHYQATKAKNFALTRKMDIDSFLARADIRMNPDQDGVYDPTRPINRLAPVPV